ncbi:hypothetical protein ABT336_11905 [Micromonospora sp. NPDC000207]|uniref:hypothetical protein n=1 Tax=Micromonospora sp. NPDC000207 TaxID=3154246 RepID=UPI00332F8735
MHTTKRPTSDTIRMFQPGTVVRHRNPELADWRGTVTPKPPKARIRWGQVGQCIIFNEDMDADVWVQWHAGDEAMKSPAAGWYGTAALNVAN